MSSLQVLQGHVYHGRTSGIKNSFRYPIFNFYFNCAFESELRSLLSKGFGRFFAVRSQDHLQGHQHSLADEARKFLSTRCDYEAEEIWLQTLPSLFGYVFNPVSFWYCRRGGVWEAVLCEVNNTFGERHYYWVKPDSMNSETWITAKKVFHVSPFFPVNGDYQFRFQLSQSKLRADIHYVNDQNQSQLATWIEGELKPLTSSSFLPLLLCYGWLTPAVMIRIHWQALKIWIKGAKFHRKPPPPESEISR